MKENYDLINLPGSEPCSATGVAIYPELGRRKALGVGLEDLTK